MPQTLTELAIRAAKPLEKGAATLWDASLRNFGCRINRGGAKSFIVLLGSGRRKTIGRFPIISLAEARAEAKRVLAEKTLGMDKPPTIALGEALGLFLADAQKRNKVRTVNDYTRLLQRHLAKLAKVSVGDVATRNIVHILDRLRDTPSEAAHFLAATRIFFNWCIRRTYVSANPCAKLTAAKSPPRERVLSDAELAQVYRCATTYPFPFGAVVRLLILTGQRRGEIGLLRWDWIDEQKHSITFPGEFTKNRRSHTFPYGQMVADILAALPRTSSYVFPPAHEHLKGAGVTAVNGWSNLKRAFDRSLNDVAPWTLHDLRRTFATNLAALAVRLEVTEKLLNHVSGSFGGIVGIYQRHTFQDEMRAAIEAWETKLAQIIARD
ncbi:MAG TPA: site-specific integrase [Stellaceae bacterium]|nr:site-specific integrase [Stellaceae bacterium]